MLALFPFLAGCLSASTAVIGETDVPEAVPDDPQDTGSPDRDTAETPDPLDIDDDGDGSTENEGDCDDANPAIGPGIDDLCDGIDNNCDGSLDEDAADPYEPNDAAAAAVGNLDEDPNILVWATLHNDDDLDNYTFTTEDDLFDFFTIRVELSGIPAPASYQLTIEHLDGNGVIYQAASSSSLSTTIEDDVLKEDGGTYRVSVDSESGSDCGASYLLTLELE